MAHELPAWHELGSDSFYTPGPEIVYVDNYGYLTDHLPPDLRRDDPAHWDGRFFNAEAEADKPWVPRHGPLELVHTLAEAKRGAGDTEPFRVLHVSGGVGDFSTDLATLPGINVMHVDFSTNANDVTHRRAERAGVGDQLTIIEGDNAKVMQELLSQGWPIDFVFFYGGVGENTPLEAELRETIRLGTELVRPGGHMWYVGLQDAFLLPPEARPTEPLAPGYMFPTAMPGEFLTRPGVATDAILSNPDMYVVVEGHGARPDRHPLVPGGPPEDHMHDAHRLLAAKRISGRQVYTPPFGFKDAVSPDWPNTWQEITSTRRKDY